MLNNNHVESHINSGGDDGVLARFEKRRGNGGRSHPPCYFLTQVNSNPYGFSSNVRWPRPTALHVNVLNKATQIIEGEYPEQSKKKTLKVNVLNKARQKIFFLKWSPGEKDSPPEYISKWP
jgi:hypothetical protein